MQDHGGRIRNQIMLMLREPLFCKAQSFCIEVLHLRVGCFARAMQQRHRVSWVNIGAHAKARCASCAFHERAHGKDSETSLIHDTPTNKSSWSRGHQQRVESLLMIGSSSCPLALRKWPGLFTYGTLPSSDASQHRCIESTRRPNEMILIAILLPHPPFVMLH